MYELSITSDHAVKSVENSISTACIILYSMYKVLCPSRHWTTTVNIQESRMYIINKMMSAKIRLSIFQYVAPQMKKLFFTKSIWIALHYWMFIKAKNIVSQNHRITE